MHVEEQPAPPVPVQVVEEQPVQVVEERPAPPAPVRVAPPPALPVEPARASRDLEPTPEAATPEATLEPEVIDVSNDQNARSQRPAVVPAATATPMPTPPPTPTAAPPQPADLVGSVVAESFEPVLLGGRLGLAGAAVTGLGLLALRLARRRR